MLTRKSALDKHLRQTLGQIEEFRPEFAPKGAEMRVFSGVALMASRGNSPGLAAVPSPGQRFPNNPLKTTAQ